MAEKKKQILSFWELLKDYKIEIPIIQRDYAQGRQEYDSIRNNFLNALKECILQNKNINLDFIYGNIVDNNIFQPLDGQQRLTTLFLLHVYAYQKELNIDENVLSILKKFTYETRMSAREFCNAIVLHKFDIKQDSQLSKNIIDSEWFFLSWKNDPSIRAMLNTLDNIHKEFCNISDLWKALIDKKLITFYHLILEDFGLSDDLYIKMNARGKLLSSFENLKAEIQNKIKENDWEKTLSSLDKFAFKIDTKWTDFLWNNYRSNNKIDSAHMRLISSVIMHGIALGYSPLKGMDRYSAIQKIQSQEINYEKNLVNYLNKEVFDYLCNIYDLYSNLNTKNITPNINLIMWRHNIEKNLAFEILKKTSNQLQDTASYTHKVLFFAQNEYLLNNDYIETKFNDWMRVVRNIVSRGDIDANGKRPDIIRSPETFSGAINLIKELSSGSENIYQYLYNHDIKSSFAKEQMKEEKIKAEIVIKYPKYKDLIFQIEDNELLRGKIMFALECANFRNKIEDIDWDLLKQIQEVLNKNFNSETMLTNDLRRAMLTIEVNRKYEFYMYWESFWTIGNAEKRKLFIQFRELEFFIYSEFSEYFKKLILLLTKKSYQDIIDEFEPPVDMPNWKRRLIKEKDLLDNGNITPYIAIAPDNSYCYLLRNKRPRVLEGNIKID